MLSLSSEKEGSAMKAGSCSVSATTAKPPAKQMQLQFQSSKAQGQKQTK
jgi:hypothetical protein